MRSERKHRWYDTGMTLGRTSRHETDSCGSEQGHTELPLAPHLAPEYRSHCPQRSCHFLAPYCFHHPCGSHNPTLSHLDSCGWSPKSPQRNTGLFPRQHCPVRPHSLLPDVQAACRSSCILFFHTKLGPERWNGTNLTLCLFRSEISYFLRNSGGKSQATPKRAIS